LTPVLGDVSASFWATLRNWRDGGGPHMAFAPGPVMAQPGPGCSCFNVRFQTSEAFATTTGIGAEPAFIVPLSQGLLRVRLRRMAACTSRPLGSWLRKYRWTRPSCTVRELPDSVHVTSPCYPVH